ncbi:type II/IV secretion system protein, partial [Candidatus Daviesbacteria bacterium]|nr:type II/IV secretion system protein [Candidatus Daviesbacteria bacterium]
VAMSDPLDLQVIQFIEKKTGLKVVQYLGFEGDILKAISTQYSQNLTSEVTSALKEVSSFTKQEEIEANQPEVIREAPVSNIVNQLLEYAVKTKASDIHIEPEENQTRVRYRIDGILHEKVILPKKVHDALVSRVKILSHLKIDERRLPQDGRFSFEFGGQEVDLRVSTLPTVYGEKAVLRLLPKSEQAPTLPELGLRGNALKNLEVQILRPHGIIVICGPTGSGKTTTLYSLLSRLSTTKVNVLTIEDPVEYQIPGANQVQVNPQIGLTFASALRSFLRQDPNIMLVGEIRDTETAELAIQAALTGHEVFSTLHTNTASGALPRLLDMGIEPFLLASAINCIVGQRILRKLCDHCRVSYNPPPEVIENIKQTLGNLLPNKPIVLYKGAGCSQCSHTGYQGRTGIYEVMVVSEKIMKLTLERASSGALEKESITEGMITMKQDGYLKVLEGITSFEEVLRVAQD